MLRINKTSQHKSNVSFGTTLKVDKELFKKIPEASYLTEEISRFRDFLAKDGKNWTAQLSEDAFSHKLDDTQIRKLLNSVEEQLAVKDLLPKMQNIKERDSIIENYINISLTKNTLTMNEIHSSEEAMSLIGLHSNQAKASEFIKNTIVRASKWHTLDTLAYNAGKAVGDIKDFKLRQELTEFIKNGDRFDCASAQEGLLSSKNLSNEELIPLLKHFTAQGGTYNGYNDCWNKGGIINAIFRLKGTKVQEDVIKDLATNEKTKAIIPDILKSDKIANTNLFDELMDNCIIHKVSFSTYNDYSPVVSILGKINDEDKAISYIKDCTNRSSILNENNPYYAAMSSSFIKNNEKRVKLIDELMQSENPEVRLGVASGIGHIEDSETAAVLIKKYKNRPDEKVVEKVIHSITDIKDRNVAKSLVTELENDNNPKVKNAIESLKNDYFYQAKFKDSADIDKFNLKITDGGYNLVGEYSYKKDNNSYTSNNDIFNYLYKITSGMFPK